MIIYNLLKVFLFIVFFLNIIIIEKENALWICKPSDLSQGKKISIISELNQLSYNRLSVIQRV